MEVRFVRYGKTAALIGLAVACGLPFRAKSDPPKLSEAERREVEEIFRRYISPLSGDEIYRGMCYAGAFSRGLNRDARKGGCLGVKPWIKWWFDKKRGFWESMCNGLRLRQGVFYSPDYMYKQKIIGSHKLAERVLGALYALTTRKFALLFFPEGFRYRGSLRQKMMEGSCYHGQSWESGDGAGCLKCEIFRLKLKKDEKDILQDPEKMFLWGYSFYRIVYTEVLSGCSFEMVYCFNREGYLVDWFPSDGTCEKILPEFLRCNISSTSIVSGSCFRDVFSGSILPEFFAHHTFSVGKKYTPEEVKREYRRQLSCPEASKPFVRTKLTDEDFVECKD